MSNKYLYRVIPLLTVVFLFATLVTPAFADSTPAFVVDISDAIKEVSYTDDEVYITYDVPLDPFSSIYGYEVGSDTLTHILDSTYIHFSQGDFDTVSFFRDVFVASSLSLTYRKDLGNYFLEKYFPISSYASLFDATSMFVNGVEYPVYISGSPTSEIMIRNFPSGDPVSENDVSFRFLVLLIVH